jgi:MFS family permease
MTRVEPTTTQRGALRAFGYAGYPLFWSAAVLYTFAVSMERVVVGWYVLEQTGSPFLTALSFAVRMAPNLVLGPVSGAIADRYDRPAVLTTGALLKTAVLVFSYLVIVALGDDSVALLLGLVAMSGALMGLQLSSFNATIPDLVGGASALNATSLATLGQRGIGVVGGLVAGFMIATLGAAEVFLVAAMASLLAAAAYRRVTAARTFAAVRRALGSEVAEGLRLIRAVPLVTALLVTQISVEVLGFSFMSLLPVLAEEVLKVGPEGLGALTAAASVGGLVGMAALAQLGDYRRKGALLLSVIAGFGLLLIVLAGTSVFGVALIVVGGVGAVAAMTDTLEWVLLQGSVASPQRGRALGIWSMAIGVGWVGSIVLGLIAEAWGVQAAFVLAGGLLAMIAAGAALLLPNLRRA